ncbi:MAG: hypothetical protein ACLGQH_02815 [Acidobacteriota bacterium]
MLPFLRPRNDKDIGDKLVGKRRKYRLPRNGSAVGLTGVLLSHYRREILPDGLMPPSGGRVELFAVIRTQAGRFFCYYVVTYPETEDIAGRQEYAHVCPDFEAVRDFLGAMAYPNRGTFAEPVLAAARKTLSVLDPVAYPPLPDAPDEASQAQADAAVPADPSSDATADVPSETVATAPAPGEDTPRSVA